MSRYLVNPLDRTLFETEYAIVYADINGGNHLAADRVYTIAIEAKLRLFDHLGYTYPQKIEGGVFFAANLQVDFIDEGFSGDRLKIATDINATSDKAAMFTAVLCRVSDNKEIARVKNTLVYVDGESGRPASIPQVFRDKIA